MSRPVGVLIVPHQFHNLRSKVRWRSLIIVLLSQLPSFPQEQDLLDFLLRRLPRPLDGLTASPLFLGYP
jgi:hypothetical protein